jgi:hypothetical protein
MRAHVLARTGEESTAKRERSHSRSARGWFVSASGSQARATRPYTPSAPRSKRTRRAAYCIVSGCRSATLTKTRPRCMKLSNSSNDAQPGLNSTASPTAASCRARAAAARSPPLGKRSSGHAQPAACSSSAISSPESPNCVPRPRRRSHTAPHRRCCPAPPGNTYLHGGDRRARSPREPAWHARTQAHTTSLPSLSPSASC